LLKEVTSIRAKIHLSLQHIGYINSIIRQEVKIMSRRSAFLTVTLLKVVTILILAFSVASPALAAGATQISGIAYWPGPGQCTDPEGEGADYAVIMTGDLEGCHYTFVETSVCSPGESYNETGTEIFVGQYNGGTGTFSTTYRFTAKYEDCPSFAGEVVGRCQHPIVVRSGRGVFEGMTGRDLRMMSWATFRMRSPESDPLG
jgi:hypothetical protein